MFIIKGRIMRLNLILFLKVLVVSVVFVGCQKKPSEEPNDPANQPAQTIGPIQSGEGAVISEPSDSLVALLDSAETREGVPIKRVTTSDEVVEEVSLLPINSAVEDCENLTSGLPLDESSVLGEENVNVSFRELPIFSGPVSPTLCYLKHAILDDADLALARDSFFSNNLESARMDLFQIGMMLRQVILQEPYDIDVEDAVNKTRAFSGYVENKLETDRVQAERTKNNIGLASALTFMVATGVVGGKILKPFAGKLVKFKNVPNSKNPVRLDPADIKSKDAYQLFALAEGKSLSMSKKTFNEIYSLDWIKNSKFLDDIDVTSLNPIDDPSHFALIKKGLEDRDRAFGLLEILSGVQSKQATSNTLSKSVRSMDGIDLIGRENFKRVTDLDVSPANLRPTLHSNVNYTLASWTDGPFVQERVLVLELIDGSANKHYVGFMTNKSNPIKGVPVDEHQKLANQQFNDLVRGLSKRGSIEAHTAASAGSGRFSGMLDNFILRNTGVNRAITSRSRSRLGAFATDALQVSAISGAGYLLGSKVLSLIVSSGAFSELTDEELLVAFRESEQTQQLIDRVMRSEFTQQEEQ